ncbi:serine/threonine-protein kinase [Klenkia terrae]|uniref:serine/threonine-protein kinase n=1 Tax=Klenkia terrae TaxID=1052259 RepID=UPI00360D1C12
MLAPGDTFAGYTVVRELGTGGMGAVYLVQHPRLPRTDALKVLRRELCSDPAFTRRFLREAELVAGLSHRNVVPVLDRGEVDGQLWLTMAFVDGQDVEGALAAAGGRLPPERAVHVVTEVAAALDAAHRQGLVHRDVKPANILLRPGDDDEPEQVFLTDFGIAKPLEAGSTRLTRTGMVIATFDYASPEQVESRDLGPPRTSTPSAASSTGCSADRCRSRATRSTPPCTGTSRCRRRARRPRCRPRPRRWTRSWRGPWPRTRETGTRPAAPWPPPPGQHWPRAPRPGRRRRGPRRRR